jgi:hypothetical protein
MFDAADQPPTGDAAEPFEVAVIPPCDRGGMFDIAEHLDNLRCHPTAWLHTRRAELVREQRALFTEQLAITWVLDERHAIDTTSETMERRDGVAPRTVRAELDMARQLGELPAIAAAAHAGALSLDQLKPLVEVATPETDAAWAQRAPGYSPVDLELVARRQRPVTAEDAEKRREAREFRIWMRRDTGMYAVRGELPDVDGALVKSVFDVMIERQRPPKGGTWDTRAHRGADALVDLCTNYADAVPIRHTRPHVVVQVPLEGPAEVDGIPIAESTLADVMASANISTAVIDANTICGTRHDGNDIPEAVKRFVRQRDQHCRVGTCDEADSVDYHHLRPRCQGGTHDPNNVVLAGRRCGHHPMLDPNGPYILEGDPSRPDGLLLVHRDDLARAGPSP